MEVKDLWELYHSKKNTCCKCGCELQDVNGELGSVFILDYDGNFYCTNCDKDFVDGDERIFDARLYPKVKVTLQNYYDYPHIVYAYGDKEDIRTALEDTFQIVQLWLECDCDTMANGIPENYSWCSCDEEFYIETLRSQFNMEEESFDEELSYYF